MEFKDLFSTQASDYARYRPLYPEALYQYLASLCPRRDLALDVGTGNGQAAAQLAKYFVAVVGTDPSEKQLSQAEARVNLSYLCRTAENSGLEKGSVDLITVAQAFHWFDQLKFFAEVKRIARPGGALAIWTYSLAEIDPAVDAVTSELYQGLLAEYWDPARKLVEQGYANERIPFVELKPPPIAMEAAWTFAEWMGYLGTWSALQKYKQEKGQDPRELVFAEMQRAWGDPAAARRISWPLAIRAFRL